MNNRRTQLNYALDLAKRAISEGQVTDAKAINQSIESILMTGRDERVFEEYGSFIPSLIFSRINKNTAREIMEGISNLLLKYEKRISLIPSSCKITIYQSANAVDVKLVYVITASSSVGEFNKRLIF